MPIRLAIVDGHTLIRYGLSELVARHADIEIVAECRAAADALEMIATARPDVVTVDVTLPDGDGLQLARELRDNYADLGIVILTSRQEDDVLFRALETGVSAFVPKTAPVEEVLAAIRHASVAAASFTASGLAMAVARRRATRDRLALSPRETEVLNLLHKGLSIPAMATELYISVSTAKTYVARLYDKLGAANRTQALMTALRHGLIDYPMTVPAYGAQPGPGPAYPRHNRDVLDGQAVNGITGRMRTEPIVATIALAPARAPVQPSVDTSVPAPVPSGLPAGSL
jgi:DNA-binding NarL/FixJ family response regulator